MIPVGVRLYETSEEPTPSASLKLPPEMMARKLDREMARSRFANQHSSEKMQGDASEKSPQGAKPYTP